MSAKEAWDLIYYGLWPLAAAAVLIGGSAYLAITWVRRRSGGAVRGERSLLLALTTLGLTIGFSTSHSREAAVGAVLPALVTLMASAFTYAVTKEGLTQFRSVLPHCITILSIASLVGLSLGSNRRQNFDSYDRQEALKQIRFEKFELETAKAQYLAQLEVWKAGELAKLANPTPDPPSAVDQAPK